MSERALSSTAESRGPVWGSFLAVAGAAAWIFRPDVAGADLFWHLASGREIWQRGAIPSSDPFSYTFAGREWMNHEWLWDVISWALYRVHPEAVAWLNVALIVALFSAVFAVARRASGSALAAGAALWLGAAAAHWFLDIRPHLVTLLFVLLLLWTRDHPRAPWLWPVLMALWVNLHAGFVFGLGAIGLLVLTRTVEASWGARRLVAPRREWIALGLCLVAWLVNPWGWRIVEYPLAYLESASPYRDLLEWQPPALAFDPRRYEARFWCAALLAVVGAAAAIRRDRYLVALAVPALCMAVTSRRFIPLFLFVSAPLVASSLAAARSFLVARLPPLGTRAAVRATGAAALLVALAVWKDARPFGDLFGQWTSRADYPSAALRYLVALGPPQRVLNHYNWGGFLMLEAPEVRHFIDGRANTVYDDEIYGDYVGLNWGRRGAAERVSARYRPDAALVPLGTVASSLLQLARPWRIVYRDTAALILLPPDSPLLATALPAPDSVLGGEPELLLTRAAAAHARGDDAAAVEDLRQAVALEPLQLRAYGALAAALARRGELDEAAAAIDAGIRTAPRFRGRLRDMEGRAYLAAGHPELALPALRAALPTGPFGRPESQRQMVERVERQLATR